MKLNNYKDYLPDLFREVSVDDLYPLIRTTLHEQISKHQGLYLWGEPGTGKTHQAWAIAIDLMRGGFQVLFCNVGEMLEKFREEFDTPNDEGGYFKYVHDFPGILILDDIGAEKANDWVIGRLLLILNHRYETQGPIIFTSNCDLESLSGQMRDRISSRIAGMTIRINVTGVDRRYPQIEDSNLINSHE